MNTDEWVTRALADDDVVAEFLLRLKQPTAATRQLPPIPPPVLTWGVRQARSKSAVKKEKEFTRFSPTTPLSWSGGGAGSPSDSDPSSAGRSKGTYTNDSITISSANKPSIRKKRFTEIQEEETLLLKEGIHLETELETLHVTQKKQKIKSENLERLKTDLHQQSAFGVASKPYFPEGLNFRQADGARGSCSDYIQASNDIKNMYENYTVPAATNSVNAEKGFILPDLNMPLSEDDSAFDSLNGFR